MLKDQPGMRLRTPPSPKKIASNLRPIYRSVRPTNSRYFFFSSVDRILLILSIGEFLDPILNAIGTGCSCQNCPQCPNYRVVSTFMCCTCVCDCIQMLLWLEINLDVAINREDSSIIKDGYKSAHCTESRQLSFAYPLNLYLCAF